MGRVSNGEVWDWSGDPSKCPGRVEYTMGSTGRVVRPTGRSGTGRGTLEDIRDG